MAVYKISPASGKVTGTSSNMPLLLIPSATVIGTLTTAEANSIRIYSDSGLTTELAREVVSADEIHFKASSVSSSSEFWVDIDGVRADYAVTDTYGRNAVWSDYGGVYHLSNVNDSTSNGLNMTNNNSATFGAQKIGNGATFVRSSSQWLSRAYNSALNIGGGDFTTSLWVRSVNSTALQYPMGMGWDAGNANLLYTYYYDPLEAVNKLKAFWYNGSFRSVLSTTSISSNTWYYWTFRKTGSTISLSVNNGTPVTTTQNTTLQTTTAGNFTIGGQGNLGPSPYWDGQIDEVRVSKTYRSDDWIATEYQNQNNNGTFWDVTVAGTFSPTPMMHQMMMAGGMV
jgi:hypothetical protein